MNKTRVEKYREALRDVSQNFEAENFIKQRTEEICERKKIPLEEVFYFYIFLCFQCYSMMLIYPSHEKQLLNIAM